MLKRPFQLLIIFAPVIAIGCAPSGADVGPGLDMTARPDQRVPAHTAMQSVIWDECPRSDRDFQTRFGNPYFRFNGSPDDRLKCTAKAFMWVNPATNQPERWVEQTVSGLNPQRISTPQNDCKEGTQPSGKWDQDMTDGRECLTSGIRICSKESKGPTIPTCPNGQTPVTGLGPGGCAQCAPFVETLIGP